MTVIFLGVVVLLAVYAVWVTVWMRRFREWWLLELVHIGQIDDVLDALEGDVHEPAS